MTICSPKCILANYWTSVVDIRCPDSLSIGTYFFAFDRKLINCMQRYDATRQFARPRFLIVRRDHPTFGVKATKSDRLSAANIL